VDPLGTTSKQARNKNWPNNIPGPLFLNIFIIIKKNHVYLLNAKVYGFKFPLQ
jgi:hypothetical protein